MDHPLKNWIPYKFITQENELTCKWLHIENVDFARPFFDEVIAGALHKPFNSSRYKVCSGLDFLHENISLPEYVKPSAIIFHISRCGSTILSQLLALSEKNIVLPEVPFFDDILRLQFKHKNEASPKMLENTIALHCQRRIGTEKHAFIKTDSWHIFFYEKLRQLYPDIPFFLLYRQPDEVIASIEKKPGMQSVAGVVEPALFGFPPNIAEEVSFSDYPKLVLEKYFEKYLEIMKTDKNSFLLNYNEGILNLVQKISRRCDIDLGSDEIRKMQERSAFDAKAPTLNYKVQKINKREGMENVQALYDQLEAIRCAEVSSG